MNKTAETESSKKNLEKRLESLKEINDFYQGAVQAFLYFIKEFSLDLTEIDSDQFKGRIDELSIRFKSETKTKKLQRVFEENKDLILSYISQEKDYFLERDAEFTNIIEILRLGITGLADDNQKFNGRLQEQGSKLERITQLDDIRRIKEALKREVVQLKDAIRQKQEQDQARIEKLSEKVENLQFDLQQAKDESMIDGLTGVFNRLTFDSYIKKLVERHAVKSTPFTLLMLDVDDFKPINDKHGHRVGDRVLVALVQKCKALIRKEDFIARYGGEEFAIILPGTSLRKSTKKAKAICKSIASTVYKVGDMNHDRTLSFTVSIGVDAIQKGDSVDSVIERADQALYQAKRLGKNRVVSEKDLPGKSKSINPKGSRKNNLSF